MHGERRKADPIGNSDVSPLARIPLASLGKLIALLILIALSLVYVTERSRAQQRAAIPQKTDRFTSRIGSPTQRLLVEQGRQIFRFDTFGDEAFWGDTLKLHLAIEGTEFGGVGPGVQEIKNEVDSGRTLSRSATCRNMPMPLTLGTLGI